MSTKSAGVFKLFSQWLFGMKLEMEHRIPFKLKVQSYPNYSTNGLPGFAVIPICITEDTQQNLSPVTSADVKLKAKHSTNSNSDINLGHGLFTVTNGQLKIHISQSDMHFGIPMASHLLGTIDEDGNVRLLEGVHAELKIKYDSQRKISRIDLTFVLSEGKIIQSENDMQT